MRKGCNRLIPCSLFPPHPCLQAPEPPIEKAAIPPEFTAMVATFDGLKEQIKAAASSPVSPRHLTNSARVQVIMLISLTNSARA